MANELSTGAGTGNTVYAHVLNSAKRRWNGSAFEAYDSSSYPDYTITMSEQGISGVYVGDFPSGITDSGVYEIYYYIGSGSEGDPIAGVGSVDWDGSSVSSSSDSVSGEMSGSDFYSYVIRTFKRTDKSVEAYDAINESISEIRREIRTSREEAETAFTDTISTLGEYRLDLESDFSSFVSDVYIRDSGNGFYLTPISKEIYDNKYGKWGTQSSERGRPRHYCVFGGQVLLGPVPDSTSYTYVLSYTSDEAILVTSSTLSVPFTKTDYREILKHGVLFRLYAMVENDIQEEKYRNKWLEGLEKIDRKERRNRRAVRVTVYRDC